MNTPHSPPLLLDHMTFMTTYRRADEFQSVVPPREAHDGASLPVAVRFDYAANRPPMQPQARLQTRPTDAASLADAAPSPDALIQALMDHLDAARPYLAHASQGDRNMLRMAGWGGEDLPPWMALIVLDPLRACILMAFVGTLVGIAIGCGSGSRKAVPLPYRGAGGGNHLRDQMARRRDAINHLLDCKSQPR